MSLDGFVTGPHDSIERPLGIGGERLHEWIFGGETDRSGTAPRTSASGSNREILDELFRTLGAVAMGRRWFDVGESPWGENPPFQVPCFVVTHRPRAKVTKGATSFTFVTEGIQSALDKARAAAGDKHVIVGGANIAQQCLRAGLLDEIQTHLVPVILGEGCYLLFESTGLERIELARTRIIESPGVTHLRLRVVK